MTDIDPTRAAEIVVEQRHRDAAVGAWVQAFGKSHVEDRIMAIAEGRDDKHPLVQAFARFEASLRPTDTARDLEIRNAVFDKGYWVGKRVATPLPVTDETALSGEARAREIAHRVPHLNRCGSHSRLSIIDGVTRPCSCDHEHRAILAALASTPQPASAETIELAVAAERERCAKICDREATLRIQRAGSNDSNWGDPSVQIHKSVTAKRLAAVIRQSAKGGE